jgi:hydrogenase expression/formation protein HypC
MCIAIPGKVKAIVDENIATIDMGGICRDVNMALMGGANESMIGKHFLVHVGYAISEISEEESEETMRLLKIMAGLDETDPFESESP